MEIWFSADETHMLLKFKTKSTRFSLKVKSSNMRAEAPSVFGQSFERFASSGMRVLHLLRGHRHTERERYVQCSGKKAGVNVVVT